MSKSRSWVFTINNHTVDDLLLLLDHSDADYFHFGFEIGESGTPHMQGYLQYKNTSVTMKHIKKYLPKAHLEIAKGNYQQNLDYCSKDGDFYSFGEPPSQGKRNDLNDLCDMITKGHTFDDIYQQHPSSTLRYVKNIDTIMSRLQKPRDPNNPPLIYWLYGPGGCGKTSYIYKHLSTDIYEKMVDNKWWDDYNQQECILIDDFSSDCGLSFRFMLRLLDRYPLKVEAKGTFKCINSKIIVITSDRPPREVYSSLDDAEYAQLSRRITHEIDMTKTAKIEFNYKK